MNEARMDESRVVRSDLKNRVDGERDQELGRRKKKERVAGKSLANPPEQVHAPRGKCKHGGKHRG